MKYLVPVFFEVMDKEPSIPMVWAYLGSAGLVGAVMCWYRRILIFPALLLVFLPLYAMYTEFFDPSIYPAIIRENPAYISNFCAAAVVSIILPVIGLVVNLMSGRDKSVEV